MLILLRNHPLLGMSVNLTIWTLVVKVFKKLVENSFTVQNDLVKGYGTVGSIRLSSEIVLVHVKPSLSSVLLLIDTITEIQGEHSRTPLEFILTEIAGFLHNSPSDAGIECISQTEGQSPLGPQYIP